MRKALLLVLAADYPLFLRRRILDWGHNRGRGARPLIAIV